MTKSATEKKAPTLSAKEIAAEFETTPRRIRKFFRATIGGVDKGNRYSFTPAEVRKMRKQFDSWSAEQVRIDEAKTSKATGKTAAA